MKIFRIGLLWCLLLAGLPALGEEGGDSAAFKFRCDAGDARACFQLGETFLFGTGGELDVNKAVRMFRKSCAGYDSLGCVNVGLLTHHKGALRQDNAGIIAAVQQGCSNGHVISCTHLGFKYQAGQGLARSYSRAAGLYRTGCDGGDAKACSHLGVLLENGLGVAQDVAQARALYQRGCDAGNERGCQFLSFMDRRAVTSAP